MVSVGKEYRQTLFSEQYLKKLIHKGCSGVRGDLSRVADVSGVDDVMGQSRKLI